MLTGGVLAIIGKLIAGSIPDLSDFGMIVAGVALIMAKDGGH